METRSSSACVALTTAVLIGAATWLGPSRAEACGGCFVPMGTPTAVDAHRMVIAVGSERTVLWDQIVYEGNPSDFVWVLPVASGTVVELADNAFFEALTAETQIRLIGPPPPSTFCAEPCGEGRNPFGGYGAAAQADAGVGSVRVEHQGVVGPYETATIASDDPDALLAWLAEHGYQVDDALRPTIAFYADQRLSFAVLRLSSGAGIDRMQPVRVAFPGTSPSLPLRMVAAGAGVDLNLELFVFAESRMEVVGYGNAEVDRAAITYDWATGTFDYDQRFEDALFAGDAPGSNWVTEYAMPIIEWSRLESYATYDGAGTMHTAGPDVAVVRSAFPGSVTVHLTRLRTRLRPNDLREDLTLRLSSGAELPARIDVTAQRNRAPDRVCPTVCESSDGLAPGGSATRGGGASYRCSVSVAGRVGGGLGTGAFALAGLTLAIRARRRARSVQSR